MVTIVVIHTINTKFPGKVLLELLQSMWKMWGATQSMVATQPLATNVFLKYKTSKMQLNVFTKVTK